MSGARLVATDLDGTLVHSDGSVTPRTREVLAELDRRGVPVVFVTGRPLRWAIEVFEHVGEHGLAVVSNGALVWNVPRHTVHLQRLLEPAVAREVCRLIRAAVPGATFAVEGFDGIGLEPGFLERHAVPEGSRRAPVEQLLDHAAIKLLARHEEATPQEFWDAAAQAVGDRAVITWSSATALLEISAAGVTKASTLALVCAELGIAPADVVAFGDMPNDIPMLEWAGTSYAMANAHASVRAAADHLAPGNDEDGVATTLTRIFGL